MKVFIVFLLMAIIFALVLMFWNYFEVLDNQKVDIEIQKIEYNQNKTPIYKEYEGVNKG